MSKTKSQIVDESVDYIVKNGRCINRNGSLYTNGKVCCSVGRCMVNPYGFVPIKFEWLQCNYEAVLKQEYRGHSVEFWQQIQNLHDWNYLWISSKGVKPRLSQEGVDFVTRLKERFCTT